MAVQADFGGNSVYANDFFPGNTVPGSLSGTALSTTNTNLNNVQTGTNITGATLAPTAAQSGTTFVLSRLAGVTVTLPAPAVGLKYTFVVGGVPTSNAHKVITSAGTVFLLGGVYIDKALTITRYDADGSTIVSINLNGTTTGGLTIGDQFDVICVSATEWTVAGTLTASGTLATPFATT